ncbi:MAG: hypothetical protein HYS70_00040 [Nitrospinae bacterium]|nr:hypothetical protein [Nitrospinota bacterium]
MRIFVENVKCLCKNINDSLGKVIFEVESAKNLYSLCNVVVYNGKMECRFKLKIELSEDLSQKFIYVIFYYRKFRKLDFRLGKWATLIKNRYYRSRSDIKTVKEIYVNPDRVTDRDLEEWLKWIYHGFKRSYTPSAIKSRKR